MQTVVLVLLGAALALGSPTPNLEEFGDWSPWTDCSAPCGTGFMTRTIACNDLDFNRVIDPCKQTKASCNSYYCPNDPNYVMWRDWTECSAPCDGGIRTRKGRSNSGADVEKINCGMQTCDPVNPDQECGIGNLVFVLDSSHSVSEINWYIIKQFVIDIISKLTIGADMTHVGVVIYASDVHIELGLDDIYDAEELKMQVWQLPWLAGATNTGEALRAMRKIVKAGQRKDVKDIVILLSDGKTNIVPEIVQTEAQKAKDEGCNIFSIGVSSEIDEQELVGCASEPKDKYYSFVSNFEDLQTIIDEIVSGACEITNTLVCGAWSEWSTCPISCGEVSTQTRTKTCQLMDSNGNVLEENIIKEKSQPCGGDPCLPPATEPPTDPPAPAAPVMDCSTCDYGPYGKVTYLPDPLNCNCYYQCQRLPADGSYTYLTHHMCCAPGLTWRPSWMTCVAEMFKEIEGCVEQVPIQVTNPTTIDWLCPMLLVPGKPGYFLNAGHEQYCGDNKVFDLRVCTCVPSNAGVVACDSDVLLYFPFDDDLHDHSCHRAVSTQTSTQNVVLVNDKERGTVAKFAGACSLHVGFLYNWFADRKVTAWSMTVWIKRTGSYTGLGGVLNNGDCIGGPSFDIHVGQGEVASCGVDTDGVSALAQAEAVTIATGDWEHVAMVYDGKNVNMFLNGEKVSNAPVTGAIENRQCPMNIGAEHAGSDYFTGLMDDVYIYDRVLTESQIETLANL